MNSTGCEVVVVGGAVILAVVVDVVVGVVTGVVVCAVLITLVDGRGFPRSDEFGDTGSANGLTIEEVDCIEGSSGKAA